METPDGGHMWRQGHRLSLSPQGVPSRHPRAAGQAAPRPESRPGRRPRAPRQASTVLAAVTTYSLSLLPTRAQGL